MKTSDGGTKWKIIEVDVNEKIAYIFFIDKTTGWIASWLGKILITTDSGENWKEISDLESGIKSLFFIDKKTGWAAGSEGKIFNTNDGGITWKQQKSEVYKDLYSIYFIDSKKGWIVGDYATILHTTNGGNSWQIQKIIKDKTEIDNDLRSVFAIDKNNVIAAGLY